jgi:hypothetical protein
VDDVRLVLVEGQPPWRQPLGELCFDLFGLCLTVTQDEEVIGLCRLPGYAERGPAFFAWW